MKDVARRSRPQLLKGGAFWVEACGPVFGAIERQGFLQLQRRESLIAAAAEDESKDQATNGGITD